MKIPDDGGLLNSKISTRDYYTERVVKIDEWGRGHLKHYLIFSLFSTGCFSVLKRPKVKGIFLKSESLAIIYNIL